MGSRPPVAPLRPRCGLQLLLELRAGLPRFLQNQKKVCAFVSQKHDWLRSTISQFSRLSSSFLHKTCDPLEPCDLWAYTAQFCFPTTVSNKTDTQLGLVKTILLAFLHGSYSQAPNLERHGKTAAVLNRKLSKT